VRFDLGEKGRELVLHHLIERRLLGLAPLVREPCRHASLRWLQRRRHDVRSSAARA